MLFRKILLSTLAVTSFAHDNILSVSTGIESHHTALSTDPMHSYLGLGFPSYAASIGLSLEKFVSNNLSYTLNANSHLIQDHISNNSYATPAFSSSFLTSYYVSPQNSVGAGLTITHSAALKPLHSICYTFQMKSWVTENLYTAFELNNDSQASHLSAKYVSHPKDLAQEAERTAYVATKFVNFYHNSIRISVGYKFLKNFALEESEASDDFDSEVEGSNLFNF